MMKHVALSVAFLLLHFGFQHVFAEENTQFFLRKKSMVGVAEERTSSRCLLVEGAYLLDNLDDPQKVATDETWHCISEEGKIYYSLEGLPDNFFCDNDIRSGETWLTVSHTKDYTEHGEVPRYTFSIPETASIGIQKAHGQKRDPKSEESDHELVKRKLVQTQGTSSVLVIRVTDQNGASPKFSGAELSDAIFGTDGDEHNLVSQFAACSGNKLAFVAGKGNNIIDGVVEVTVPYDITGVSFFDVQNWVTKEATAVVDQPLTDWTHVMIVLPKVVDMKYAGYAYYNNNLSLFKDGYATKLQILLHEIGHNLNLKHSGRGGNTLGDKTCMMGASLAQPDTPLMCFNGAKSWFLGWYSDRHQSISPSYDPLSLKLVGIDDYLNNQSTDAGDIVVAQIPSVSTTLYLMYNRKEGINREVVEMGDTVTIVQQNSRASQSWLLAGITENDEPYRYSNWNSEGNDLVISVCGRTSGTPDSAQVMVYIDDGKSDVHCNSAQSSVQPTVPPTAQPTVQPTVQPTTQPTIQPTLQPTVQPTDQLKDGLPNETKVVELQVSAGSDDYVEKKTGHMSSVATVHRLWTNNYKRQAYRFRDVPIPQGATIMEARFEMRAVGRWLLSKEVSGVVYGEATGNASEYQGQRYEISNAAKTTASVEIKNLEPWIFKEYCTLGDVTSVLQEIVNRSDFTAGNAIKLLLLENDTPSFRRVQTFESGAGAKLYVRYR